MREIIKEKQKTKNKNKNRNKSIHLPSALILCLSDLLPFELVTEPSFVPVVLSGNPVIGHKLSVNTDVGE